MRNRFLNSILGLMAVLAFSPVVLAQNAGQPRAAQAPSTFSPRDLVGIWQLARGQPGDNDLFTIEPYPMQPWAQEVFNYNQRPGPPGQGNFSTLNYGGRDEVNPQLKCIPYGFPRVVIAGARPFEILQVPGRFIILYERDHMVRQIWMDQQHPENYPPGFVGHSVGRWDGDTLVVDTINLKANWLDSAGHPQSDAMHIVERYRRSAADTLVIDYQFDDPKVYTKPFTGSRAFRLHPEFKGVMEDVLCEDPFGKGGQ